MAGKQYDGPRERGRKSKKSVEVDKNVAACPQAWPTGANHDGTKRHPQILP
jgi:hypothetical protein